MCISTALGQNAEVKDLDNVSNCSLRFYLLISPVIELSIFVTN